MIVRSCGVETKFSGCLWVLWWCAPVGGAWVGGSSSCSCGDVLACPVVAFLWWVCALCLVWAVLFFYP